MVGLISNNDETAYREEVEHLVRKCDLNNLELNPTKTKEAILDFRRTNKRVTHTPVSIHGQEVERVTNFKFLGVYISEDFTWTTNISALVKRPTNASSS